MARCNNGEPILGLLLTNAHGDQVNLFFLGQLPALVGRTAFAKQLLEVHKTVGFLLLRLITLHASAVLYWTGGTPMAGSPPIFKSQSARAAPRNVVVPNTDGVEGS